MRHSAMPSKNLISYENGKIDTPASKETICPVRDADGNGMLNRTR
jgi:hypothetical protein